MGCAKQKTTGETSIKMAVASRFGVLARSLSTSAPAKQLIKPPVQVFGTEGRYASALYSAAVKKDSLAAVEKDLDTVGALLKSDPILKEFLENPLLKKELKQDAVDSVLAKKGASELTVNLFGLLAENGKLASTGGVVSAFGQIMAAVRGEVVCEVTTAKPMDPGMQAEVEGALKAFMKEGESIQLTTKVDPSIIGGMIVVIGDKYADMSLKTKINKYTALIQQAV